MSLKTLELFRKYLNSNEIVFLNDGSVDFNLSNYKLKSLIKSYLGKYSSKTKEEDLQKVLDFITECVILQLREVMNANKTDSKVEEQSN